MLASRATASPSLTIAAAARAIARFRSTSRRIRRSNPTSDLTVLERPHAAPDPRDEALLGQLPEVAPHGDLRNGKRFRKFRNLNRNLVSRATAARDASAPAATNPGIPRASRCARPYASTPSESSTLAQITFDSQHFVSHSTSGHGCVRLPIHGRGHAASTGSPRSRSRRPSWGYGNSGTRFHVFPWPGAARSVEERIADAGLVHRLTGCCPSVALHIPWDAVDDYAALAPACRRPRPADRRHQPEPLRGRRVPPRQPLPPGRGDPCACAG